MWDERYKQPGFAFGTEPNDFLKEHYSLMSKGRVISIGEGEGRNGVFLARHGYSVLAVDSSPVGLAKAQELAAANNVSIITRCADLSRFEWDDESVTGVVSIFCHLPPTIRSSLFKKIISWLKPGGVFLLEGYSKEQLKYGTGGPKSESLLLDLHEIKEELSGLEFLKAEALERHINEGRYHDGTSAVVHIAARKPQ